MLLNHLLGRYPRSHNNGLRTTQRPIGPGLSPARPQRPPPSTLVFPKIYSLQLTHRDPQERRLLPPPSPAELQISIRNTGLCGSDLHYYSHYRNGDILVREPLSLGHESAGVVSAVGSAVTQGFKVGDRVALEVGLPCGECKRCREGRYNICSGLRFRSSAKAFPHFQGTLQERINHPAEWCHKCASPALSYLRKRWCG